MKQIYHDIDDHFNINIDNINRILGPDHKMTSMFNSYEC
jgi:hypothetical protein